MNIESQSQQVFANIIESKNDTKEFDTENKVESETTTKKIVCRNKVPLGVTVSIKSVFKKIQPKIQILSTQSGMGIDLEKNEAAGGIVRLNSEDDVRSHKSLSILSPEQLYAFNKFSTGENLFITGPGGTGKTKLIQYLSQYSDIQNRDYQVCALTGCASLLLKCNARTIHSWSGIKIAKGRKEDVIRNVLKQAKTVQKWKKIKVLIVDEISMMSCKIFEILEELGRTIRKSSLPFGGIQVVFTGDFFQLPPVGTFGEPETEMFCFESPIWQKVFPLKNHIELKTIFRQKDPLYKEILNQIRLGTIEQDKIEILNKYVKREFKPEEHEGCIPVKLFAVRNRAEYVNNSMFEKLNDTPFEFKQHIRTDCTIYLESSKPFSIEHQRKCQEISQLELEKEVEFLSNSIPCANQLLLKKGSVVMCISNVDMDRGICNGSQGIIIDIIENKADPSDIKPVVKFSNGVVMQMARLYWQSEEYPKIAIGQIPLCLAWAFTIHKIQGSTMSMAEIDIGMTIFEYGQIYVALSRIESLDGLYLINFNPSKIKANPKVIAFYEKIPEIK